MKETNSATGELKKGSLIGKVLKVILPLAVSVGLCFALFRDIDFNEMMRIIREDCNFWIIGATIVLSMVPILVRSMRWGIQLKAINVRPPLHILCYSIFGTYSFNVLFPRLGEVWRTGYIAYRQKAPFASIFGSMIADRLADTAVVALLTLVTCFFASEPFIRLIEENPDFYNKISELASSPLVWGCVVAVLVAGWITLRYAKGKLFEGLRRFIRGIWEGFAALTRMDKKGRWLLLTAILWSCYFLQMYIAFYAFPMTRELLESHGIIVAFICYMLSTISMAIPSQGGIGPYQAAVLFGLTMFEPAASIADPSAHQAFYTAGLAFGNTVIAAQTLTFIVGGIIVFLLIAADRRRGQAEQIKES